MSQLWTILKREYLDRVRRRSFLIGTVLGPVFMLGVIVLPAYLASRSTTTGCRILVVDQTALLAGKFAQTFADTLPDGHPRFVFGLEPSPAESGKDAALQALRARVLAGEATAFLWIPTDAVDGGRAELYAVKLGDLEFQERIRDGLTRSAMMVRLEQLNVPSTETDRIAERVKMKAFKLTKDGTREGGPEVDFVAGYLFAMLLYMTILLYGVSVQRSVLEDKNSRIVEILLSSSRPLPLMLGKILGVGGVGLTQYAIWGTVAAAGAAYFRAANPALAHITVFSPLVLGFFVLYFILGFFIYSGIYAAVGAMVTTEQEAQQAQWPVTSLLVVPVLFMMTVMRDPDSTTSVILSLVPFFTPVVMMMRIIVHTPPAWQLGLSVVLLALTVVATAALAARIFRVGILMYGKRATLPEILRWIRQS